MEPGQRCKYSDKTKAGLPKNRDSIPGIGKEIYITIGQFQAQDSTPRKERSGAIKTKLSVLQSESGCSEAERFLS